MNITLRDSGETKIVDFEGSLDTNTSATTASPGGPCTHSGLQSLQVILPARQSFRS
jgi:hypothetical protein